MANRPKSLRWSLVNKNGIICYVYSQTEPTHLLKAGYTNLKPAGYYDYGRNVIVDPSDPSTEIIDVRRAPGT